MALDRRSAEILKDGTLDELYGRVRGLRGFSGVDLGFAWQDGRLLHERCYRVHFKSARHADLAAKALPGSFGGLPVAFICANYHAASTDAAASDSSLFVTSGAPCGTAAGAGQIGLMVIARNSNRVGFLTSWAAAGGKDATLGGPVHAGPARTLQEDPIGHISAMKLDRQGSVAVCDLATGQQWLPIVRPANIAITALKEPKLGDAPMAGRNRGLIDGVGIYRVAHKVAAGRVRPIDICGARMRSPKAPASGAVLYDRRTATASGIVAAFDKSGDGPAISVVCNLPRVFAGLGIRLAGFDDLMDTQPRTPPFKDTPHNPTLLADPREVAVADRVIDRTILDSNDRLDIATVLWPKLAAALAVAGYGRRRVTDRVETIDPTGGALATIAAAINQTPEFAALGIPYIKPGDLGNAVTLDQVCEALNDLLESSAG